MKNKIAILFLIGLFLVPSALALDGKVAFVSSSQGQIDQYFWDELVRLGLDVQWVDSDFIAFQDMTQYDMMFINNEFFSNAELIPVNEMPTLLATSWNLKVWDWSFTSSTIGSTQPLEGNVTNSGHEITEDYFADELVKLYSTCCEVDRNIELLYLGRLDRLVAPRQYPSAPVLENLLALEFDKRDGIILTAEAGTELRKGTLSNAKGAFFGIVEVPYWTDDSRNMFDKTVDWLLRDEIPPTVSNVNVINITNTDAVITFDTNKLATVKVNYGLTQSFGSSIESNDLLLNHELQLDNLNAFSTYYFEVEHCNKHNFCDVTDVFEFTTMKNAPNSINGLEIDVDNSDRSLDLSWNVNSEALVYNVYSALTPESFDFDNPIATVSGTSYHDDGSESVKFFVVRAENDEGTEEENLNIVGKYDLDLVVGANLVSLPLVPFDNSIEDVMHQDLNYWPVIKVITLENGNMVESRFNPNDQNQYWSSDMSIVDTGVGYYFVSQEEVTFTTVGRFDDGQQTWNLVEGMNYIGLTSLNGFNLVDIFSQDQLDYNYVEISKRNQDGSYDIATYYPGQDMWYNEFNFNSLESGLGYILQVGSDVDLTYEP